MGRDYLKDASSSIAPAIERGEGVTGSSKSTSRLLPVFGCVFVRFSAFPLDLLTFQSLSKLLISRYLDGGGGGNRTLE